MAGEPLCALVRGICTCISHMAGEPLCAPRRTPHVYACASITWHVSLYVHLGAPHMYMHAVRAGAGADATHALVERLSLLRAQPTSPQQVFSCAHSR